MLLKHGRILRVGLALVVVLAVSSPVALAASGQPKPQPLWEAFPLNPTSGRLDSAKQPVQKKEPVQGRPEATKVEDTPARASRSSAIALAFFAGAALLALGMVGFLSMRRLHVRNDDPRPSVAAWQGISWPNPADGTRQLREPRAEKTIAAVGVEHRPAGLHPDVPASAYRLQKLERRPLRRSRVTGRVRRAPLSQVFAEGFTGVARRMREAVWTDRTAPVIVGTAVGILAASLLIYWVG